MNGKTKILQIALEKIFNFILMVGVVLIPLLFWSLTSEFYETPKLLSLIFLTGVLLLIWALKCVVSDKITLTKTPLDFPLLSLLAVFILSTTFAASKPVAIFGNFPRVSSGLASFIALIMFYFVVVSNLKQVGVVKQIINLLLGVGTILGILALFSYWGLNLLPFPWADILNFTPTGTSFSTSAILSLLLPFLLLSLLSEDTEDTDSFFGVSEKTITTLTNLNQKMIGIVQKAILSAVLALFLLTIILIGCPATYFAAAAAVCLVFFTVSRSSVKKNLIFLAIPALLTICLSFASFVQIPNFNNPFYQQAQKFPREVQLSPVFTWKISVSSFRDSPFWGTGPGSFPADFTAYKPLEFNTSKAWNVRFDQAFNEYLQTLATLGALGFTTLLFLTIAYLSAAWKVLTNSKDHLNLALSISGILFFILLSLHASTLPLYILGLLILSLFMAVNKGITKQIHIGMINSRSAVIRRVDEFYLRFDILPTVFLILVTIVVGTVFYLTGKTALADWHHRLALQAVTQGKGLEAYNQLIPAERLNPYIDLYRTDLAQTSFALANAIAADKVPPPAGGEASPSGSLTDQDKQNIQTLLSQAINEGKTATVLNPNSALNWEILGSIYRQISGVAENALTFSLDSYGRAIQKDPLNPLLRLTVGGIYYSGKNYDLAIRFFTDAVNLKPDFANGYYNLAAALREKGDLTEAASSAEKTVSLLDPSSPDYQTASDLLAQLRDQIASEAAKQQAQQKEQIQAPAAQESSALQDKNLPQILDLPKPENVATPEAVKK